MSEVPLKPMGKSDVRKLELALIFGTLFRPDVVERIRNAEDRLTWLDSLVVAAAALARERAGYSVRQIADEVGRTEATIRNHLQGKTEAGKLVKETYEMLVKAGGKLEIKPPQELASLGLAAAEQVREAVRKEMEEKLRKLEEEKRRVEERLKELEAVKAELEVKLKELEGRAKKAEEELTKIKERVTSARKALEEAVRLLEV